MVIIMDGGVCVCGVIIFDSVYSEDCGLKNWCGNDWIR